MPQRELVAENNPLTAADLPDAIEAAARALHDISDYCDWDLESRVAIEAALPHILAAARARWEAEQDTEWGEQVDGHVFRRRDREEAQAEVDDTRRGFPWPDEVSLVRRTVGPWVEVTE